jgi:copper chaperone CopZ
MHMHHGKDRRGLKMTNVEISYNYGMSPDKAVMRGMDNIREVYGIRRLKFNEESRSVAVEYDATRLNPETVASLLRRTGLDLK